MIVAKQSRKVVYVRVCDEALENRCLLSASAIVNPSASLTSNTLTAPAGDLQFVVTYTGSNPIRTTTLDNSDILVTGPNGFSQLAAFVGSDGAATNVNPPIFATYEISANGGTFNASNNGDYSVMTQAGQVMDTSGLTVPAQTLGNLVVEVSSGATQTNTEPTATLQSSTLTASGQSSLTFTVTYTGESPINSTTIGNSNLTVTGPNNYQQNAAFVSETGQGTNSVIATYRIGAPGGVFDSSANGNYLVTLNAGAVQDSNGVAVRPGPLDFLTVNTNGSGGGPTAGVTLSDGLLTIVGTPSSDTISVYVSNNLVNVLIGNTVQTFATSAVTGVDLLGLGGNDQLAVEAGIPSATVHGGGGADTIIATNSAGDTLLGGHGPDSITAGSGNSSLVGGLGLDTLIGGAGLDTLEGGGGRDSLRGGTGASLLDGGIGQNTIVGNNSNDTIIQ